MKKRININFLCIAFVAILFTTISISVVFYEIFKREVIEDLKTNAEILVDTKSYINMEETLSISNPDKLRITIIKADGSVIFDSTANKTDMNNHRKRPEIEEAFSKGSGVDIRKSYTLDKNAFYYALRIDDDMVIRVSKETNSMFSVYKTAFPIILVITAILLVLCMLLSHYLTKNIVKPVEEMANNIDKTLNFSAYKELMPFLNTIQKQHKDIVKNAHMRQEFTANVSHELKTPLTSISGYAELIENGMATDEDVIRFAKEIHRNSNRLLTLINDIIRLSELDTVNSYITFDKVNLKEIAINCVEMLSFNAEKNNVKISCEGVDTYVYANKDMIEELTYNLCDNAIRYNKENGKVIVETIEEDDKSMLIVTDTGIGISKENKERIFERFYRVDKSRSKRTGGTGLGLAIVKHIIAQHDNMEIEINSEIGEGTQMKVIFQKK